MLAQLFHPGPSLATALAATGLALVFHVGSSDIRLVIIFLTVLTTQLSISALNEWADRQRDRAANRRRPVAMGRVSPRIALGLAIVFGLLSLPGALAFGAVSVGIVLLGLAAGWCYDLVLKPTPLSFLPFAVAFPLLPVWVGVVTDRPDASLLPLLVGGPPLAIAIHLADAIPDRDVDQRAGIETLAVRLGRPGGEVVAVLGLLAGTAVMFAAHWRPQEILPSLTLVAAVITIAMQYLALAFRRSTADVAKGFVKWAMIFVAATVGLLTAIPI